MHFAIPFVILFLAVQNEEVSIGFMIEFGFDIQAFRPFEFAGEVKVRRFGICVHAEVGLGCNFN